MSDVLTGGTAIRAYRKREKLSLDGLADRVRDSGNERPSTAKLSRIETGEQPLPVELVPIIEQITGIPAKELRPDLAKVFERAEPQEAAE